MIMDNFKISNFIANEQLETKHVENYLQNFNKRLQELRQQNNDIFEKSVNIMKEINEVTTSVNMVENNLKSYASSLNESIYEVDNAQVEELPIKLDTSTTSVKPKDDRALTESLMLLERTKGSLGKLETFFNAVVKETNIKKPEMDHLNELVKHQQNRTLKTDLSTPDDLKMFSSCCGSEVSLKALAPSFETNLEAEQTFYDVTWSITDIGYQGDIDDSDYDNKKKSI